MSRSDRGEASGGVVGGRLFATAQSDTRKAPLHCPGPFQSRASHPACHVPVWSGRSV